MSLASDRIRRILSDAGGAVRRASDVAAPREPATGTAPADTLPDLAPFSGAGPFPGPAPPSSPGAPLPIPQRLAALHASAARAAAALAARDGVFADPLAPYRDADDRSLEVRLSGRVRAGARGSFLEVTRRRSLAERHGDVALGDALARPVPLRRTERRPGGGAAVDPRRAAFLDVETTGLAGGTGTVAFLVGVGFVDGDAFVVRQYFARDFPDEPALLDALADDLEDRPLVTFNGRSFDWPLLATRFRLHRRSVAPRDHADLLPPARRVWAGSLASHALLEIERAALGVARGVDLPGALVPAAWFDWLRTGRAGPLVLAFRHNEDDVLSLATLAARMGAWLDAPDTRPPTCGRDHLGAARLLLDHGDPGRARRSLEAAAAANGPPDVRAGHEREDPAAFRRALGALQRRAGDVDGALRTWRLAIAEQRAFDPHPYEEVAKHLEHRARDPLAALRLVREALARCAPSDPRRVALEHRARRLERRRVVVPREAS